jgi:hypothetical protein
MVGWYLPRLDRFYYPSFGIFFALVLVFTVLGNVCLAVMRFRADNKPLMNGLVENLKWIPLMTIFTGGMSMHVSQALLSHLFSIEMSWGATGMSLKRTPELLKAKDTNTLYSQGTRRQHILRRACKGRQEVQVHIRLLWVLCCNDGGAGFVCA